MLISLGGSCKVREAIQRNLNQNSLETNMFDWVISNFDSVLYFLRNIDTPIVENDFYDTGNTCLHHKIIFHKTLRFDSIHDIDSNHIYENELPFFLEKYNRRLNRLKDNILNNKKINFIHLVDIFDNFRVPNQQIYIPSTYQIQEFHNYVKKINPDCICNLHILIPPVYCKFYNKSFTFNITEINKLYLIDKTYIHYLEQDENKNPSFDQCLHWSWEKVFQFIENYC
jgi:hypothetical protein